MSLRVARAAVDLLLEYSRDESCLELTHFGGEPLLNFPVLAGATEHAEAKAAGKAIAFNITTNGTLLTPRIADYFVRHKIHVLLSLDGLAPSHDRYRRDPGGQGTFHRALGALRLLKERGQWIGVKMTVMPANLPRLVEDVRGLHALGANQFIIGHASGVPWAPDDIERYGQVMSRLFGWYRQYPHSDLRISEFDDEAAAEAHFGCQAGRDSISISPLGEISSCSKVLALDSRHLLAKLGDVRYGVTHLANRAELLDSSPLRTACDALGIARDFRGGCLATNYEDTGSLFRPSLTDHAFSLVRRSVRCTA
jgi:uncharacterized protein